MTDYGRRMARHKVLEMMAHLKLTGMKAQYDEIVSDGRKRKRSFEAILSDLLEVEIADKQARSINYQLGIARMPLTKELSEFDFHSSSVDGEQIQVLAEGDFLEEQRNVVLIGGTGTGKTHLAIALTRSCVRLGAKARTSTR